MPELVKKEANGCPRLIMVHRLFSDPCEALDLHLSIQS